MPSVALTSPELTAFRGSGHASYVWLSVVPSTTVATARINQASFTNPVIQLTVDGTSGGWSNVRKGHTVWIGTTAGARDIGVYRLREDPTSNTLYIAEMSNGDPGLLALATLRLLADNAYVTVVQDWNLWGIFPVIVNGEFRMDFNDTYTNQNELGGAVPGYVNIGGHRRGRVSGGSIPFTFTAETHWFDAGDGSFNWFFQNGTPSTATGAGPHTVSFTAGIQEVTLVATNTNGAQAIAHRWVFAHDFAVNPPYQVKVLGDRVTPQGRRISVEIIGATLDETALQTGSMVMLWEELYFEGGATLVSATTDCVGWIESVTGGDDNGVPTYRVEIFQALHRLEQIRGFSQQLTATANPSTWQEVSPALCHFNFYVFFLLYWHTTLLQLFDYEPQDFSNVLMNVWANDPGDWYTGINRLGAFVEAEFTQASDGTLRLRRKPSLMATSERNAVVERVTLSATVSTSDLAVIPEMEHRQFPEVGQTQAFAFRYDSSTGQKTGLKAYAPGETPGQSGRTEQMPDQWVVDQSELNVRVANYHASLNNPYPRIGVQLTRSNAVNALLTAPAERYWVRLDVDAAFWPENIDFNSRCVVEDIAINWNEDGTKDASLNLVPETDGNAAPGQTMPVTLDSQTDPTTVQFPPIDPIDGTLVIPYDTTFGLPPVTTPLVSVDEQTTGILFAWSANAVGVSYNPAAPSFILFWSPPVGEILQSLVYDYRSPRFTTNQHRGALRQWLLTDAGLYYCANALSSSPTVSLQSALENYRLLRGVQGVNGGLAAYGLDVELPASDYDVTFEAGGYVSYAGAEDPGHATDGQGVNTGGNPGHCWRNVRSGFAYAWVEVDLGAEVTVQAVAADHSVWSGEPPTTHDFGIHFFNATHTPLTGGLGVTCGQNSWYTDTWTGSRAGCRYVRVSQNGKQDARIDNIHITVTASGATGVGVRYSADNGTTGTVIALGNGTPTSGGYDNDDFALGCHMGSNGAHLYFTTTYTSLATLMATVNAGSAVINLVRIPHRVLTSTALNNNANALHFIYGMDGIDGSGRTLVRGVLNRGANSVTLTNITPTLLGVTYVPVGPESLETYAGDARVMILLAQPLGGGATVRLRTANAGATWALAGTCDFTFVRWTGRQRAWFAGAAGIGFTPDRAVSLADRDGDYALTIEAVPLIGAEAVPS